MAFSFVLWTLQTVSAISPECLSEWEKIYESQVNGSIPHNYWLMFQYSGFTHNNLGNFEECKKVVNSSYALITLSKSPFVIVQGLCGPKLCKASDYLMSRLPFHNDFIHSVEFPEDYQNKNYSTYTQGAKIVIGMSLIISVFVLFSTIFDMLKQDKSSDSLFFQGIQSFSIISNTQKLFSIEKDEESLNLKVLHAVRVLSLGWIILGHTILNGIQIIPYINVRNYEYFFAKRYYVLVFTGFYAVDVFFWMSGLLISFFFLSKIELVTSSFCNVFFVYFHRYFKITPVYMFCLCFFWHLMPFIGSGPLWFGITEQFNTDCAGYWYSHLFYFNNFAVDWRNSHCLVESWYLANHMQFFFISPLVLLIYAKKKVIGWVVIFSIIFGGIYVSYFVAIKYKLNPSFLAVKTGEKYYHYFYTKPYCRVPTYAIGMACGIVLYSYIQFKKGKVFDKFALAIAISFESKVKRCFLFGLGFAVVILILIMQVDVYLETSKRNMFGEWTGNQKSGFIALEKAGFIMGISLILMPIIFGYFRKVSSWLCWDGWCVMGKISFAMYMVHSSIMHIAFKSLDIGLEYSLYNSIKEVVWFYILTTLCALPVFFGIEMPITNLEKLIFRRGRKGKERKETAIENNEIDLERQKLSQD